MVCVYYYYEPEVDRMSDDQDGCEWVNVSSGSGLPLSGSSLVFLLVLDPLLHTSINTNKNVKNANPP